jgi:4-amino-4-deoxy-L-arabinose transferase-like glycosyltransferase
MEARNFIAAREMLVDGNWILTTLNGEARYQKPPLPTWITALSAAIFGLKNLTALRLPAALMTLILILVSYSLGFKLTKDKTYAFLGSLILATSFYVVFAGRNGQWDIFTHVFMMVSIVALYQFFSTGEKKYKQILIAAVFFGFSFMSKGPVSMYALLLPFLIAYGIVYKYKNLKAKVLPLILFFVISCILSLWWHWYTYLMDPIEATRITTQETSNWTGYNVRPFYYYWSFFTQSGVWTIPAFIGLLYPYLKNRVIDKKAYLFTFLWTMISLLLLSIIPEKKSRYLLPVLIPLALNTAFYIEYLFRKFTELKDKRETAPVYFNFGLIASIGLIFPVAGYFYLKDAITGKWVWFVLLSIALFAIGWFMIRNLSRRKIQPVFYLTITFISVVICFGMPLAKTLTINPEYKGLSQLKEWQDKNNIEIYEYSYFTPELIWDYGSTIKVLKKNETITIPSDQQFGVLVANETISAFFKTFENYSIEKITEYDMNPKGKEDRSHKTRLHRNFYQLTTKN